MYLKIAKQLSAQYMANPEYNATEDLVKIAQENNLNAHEIERIVNRANREIIVGLQKEAILGNQDPHFTFPTIKTAEVISMIRPEGPRAQARRPAKEKTESQKLAHNVKYSLEDFGLDEIDNAGLASQVLDVWKHKERGKLSKVAQLEFEGQELQRQFDNSAAQELLKGTPVEAIEALGVETGMIEKLSSWGHKLVHTEEEIEIVSEHPLVKIAERIVAVSEELSEAQSELEESRTKTAALKNKMRELL